LATLYNNFEWNYLQQKNDFDSSDFYLGQGNSKSDRLVHGLCPTIPKDFIRFGQ